METASILEQVSLKSMHSFGTEAHARYFGIFRSMEELQELLCARPRGRFPLLVLGGGSNLLFTGDFDGLVLKNEMGGINKLGEDDQHVWVRAGAGVNWHQFVMHCIRQGWGGIENLSLIPGCVGASPMQNIGAYGVEISSVFEELRAFHIDEKTNYTFRAKDCGFGYRDSVFKNKYKDQFIITEVSFRLFKNPVVNTSYGAILQELDAMGVTEPGIREVSEAVIRIRSSKLPDPALIGNAGSFFKNPVVDSVFCEGLKSQYPGLVAYPAGEGKMKLAAGWLIEHSGPAEGVSWKGYREGDAGCHERQALVLVNHGNAGGGEIHELALRIARSVKEKYGLDLETEVNIY